MKPVHVVVLAIVALLVMASPLWAQAPNSSSFVLSGAGMGAGLGAALTMIGAGYGFGRIGAAALESMARQPEVAGRILPAMIVIAALLEGATFFALLICLQIGGKVQTGAW
jgi:F-type H+-transporting ATPase subunit c